MVASVPTRTRVVEAVTGQRSAESNALGCVYYLTPLGIETLGLPEPDAIRNTGVNVNGSVSAKEIAKQLKKAIQAGRVPTM